MWFIGASEWQPIEKAFYRRYLVVPRRTLPRVAFTSVFPTAHVLSTSHGTDSLTGRYASRKFLIRYFLLTEEQDEVTRRDFTPVSTHKTWIMQILSLIHTSRVFIRCFLLAKKARLGYAENSPLDLHTRYSRCRDNSLLYSNTFLLAAKRIFFLNPSDTPGMTPPTTKGRRKWLQFSNFLSFLSYGEFNLKLQSMSRHSAVYFPRAFLSLAFLLHETKGLLSCPVIFSFSSQVRNTGASYYMCLLSD